MGKFITSPSKRYSGSVILYDPLTFPQYIAFKRALEESNTNEFQDGADNAILPGIIACVEEWRLERFPSPVTLETFPSTPRLASNVIIRWLIREIVNLIAEADDAPNA